MNSFLISTVFVVLLGTYATLSKAEDQLVGVIALSRHGDRSISKSFPTDPYQNISYWPDGFRQLLNKGKIRSYNLGKWLRKRYDEILPKTYKHDDFFANSSGEDTCVMSSECILAGIFEPSEPLENFSGALKNWQPIPIHYRAEDDDPFIAMLAPCPQWDMQYANLKKDKYFTDLLDKYSTEIADLSNKTGWVIDDLEYLRLLYKVYYIYKEHNASYIPSWIHSTNLPIIKFLASVSFAMETNTDRLQRLSAGPFFHELLRYMDSFIHGEKRLKFLSFTGHDTTITAILNTMGCFDYDPPEFSSTVLWEVYKKSDGSFSVRMFYLKSTETMKLEPLRFNGLCVDCKYEVFKNIMSPIAINKAQWEKECKTAS